MRQPQHAEQPAHNTNSRPLWLAIGALGIAVAAMGGVMLGMNMQDGVPAQGAAMQQHLQPTAAAGLVPFDGPDSAATPAPVRRAVPVQTSTAPVRVSTPAPRVVAQPAARCQDCGTVVSVATVQSPGAGTGVGAVAGGVVGGVLGNQIGGGSGRAIATVVGAMGGGWAGHEVEKRVRQTSSYQVRVRMEDGSVRTMQQSQPVAVGSAVVVQGGMAQAQSRTVAMRG